jgi:hypothetical protein
MIGNREEAEEEALDSQRHEEEEAAAEEEDAGGNTTAIDAIVCNEAQDPNLPSCCSNYTKKNSPKKFKTFWNESLHQSFKWVAKFRSQDPEPKIPSARANACKVLWGLTRRRTRRRNGKETQRKRKETHKRKKGKKKEHCEM